MIAWEGGASERIVSCPSPRGVDQMEDLDSTWDPAQAPISV